MKSTLVLIAFLASTLMASAGGGFYIGPLAGVRINGATGDGLDESKTVVGFNAGANVLADLGGNFRFDGGILYTQRAFGMEIAGFGDILPPTELSTAFNYLDIVLGLNWYVLGSSGLLQPYVGVAASPGFFMSGTQTTKMGDADESTDDIDSESVESFHASVMPKLGLDITIGSMLLGAAVGYDLGLTNVAAADSDSAGNFKYNSVVVNVRLAIPLGGGSDEPEVDPMNVE